METQTGASPLSYLRNSSFETLFPYPYILSSLSAACTAAANLPRKHWEQQHPMRPRSLVYTSLICLSLPSPLSSLPASTLELHDVFLTFSEICSIFCNYYPLKNSLQHIVQPAVLLRKHASMEILTRTQMQAYNVSQVKKRKHFIFWYILLGMFA